MPKERTDSDYFKPLTGLKLGDSSGSKPPRVYLGLVHANNEAGTEKRIETAQASVQFPFGVATECGLVRTPPGEIDSILRIYKEVTAEQSLQSTSDRTYEHVVPVDGTKAVA